MRGGLCFIFTYNSCPSLCRFLFVVHGSQYLVNYPWAQFLHYYLSSLCAIFQMNGLLFLKVVTWSYLRGRLLLPSITLNRSCDYFIYSSTMQFCNELPEIAQLQQHRLTVQKSLHIYWALGASSSAKPVCYLALALSEHKKSFLPLPQNTGCYLQPLRAKIKAYAE